MTEAALPLSTWNEEEDNKIINSYLLGASMAYIAQDVLEGLDSRQAESFVSSRFSQLRRKGRLPKEWENTCLQSAGFPIGEGYTLKEDVELIQWCANGCRCIDIGIFVARNRSARGIVRRAIWLCRRRNLLAKAEALEEEAREALVAADEHRFERPVPCAECDEGVFAERRVCPIVLESYVFDLTYSKLMVAVIEARSNTRCLIVWNEEGICTNGGYQRS